MEYLGNGIWADPENDRYYTQDGESWLGLEDAQAHMDENYWSQSELPMQDVIDDLREKKVENFGVLPEYYARPQNTERFDLFDSSTWMVPEKWTNDPSTQEFYNTYVPAPGAKVPMSTRERLGAIRPIDEKKRLEEIRQIKDPDEQAARLDIFDQRILDQDLAHEKYGKNIIDVISKDNPEIRTGFFPRKNYPEVSTSNLSDYLKKGFRIRKTGMSDDAGGHYSPRADEIGVGPTEEGLLPDWDRLLEIMGHEGIHMGYPHQYEEDDTSYKRRGLDALEHTMPWPENWNNKWAGKWHYTEGAGHEGILNMDQMFFPKGMRQGEWQNLNLKGVENLNSIMNWKKDMAPSTPIRGSANDQRTTNIPATGRPTHHISNIRQVNRIPNIPPRSTHHFNTGGLVSLVL